MEPQVSHPSRVTREHGADDALYERRLRQRRWLFRQKLVRVDAMSLGHGVDARARRSEHLCRGGNIPVIDAQRFADKLRFELAPRLFESHFTTEALQPRVSVTDSFRGHTSESVVMGLFVV